MNIQVKGFPKFGGPDLSSLEGDLPKMVQEKEKEVEQVRESVKLLSKKNKALNKSNTENIESERLVGDSFRELNALFKDHQDTATLAQSMLAFADFHRDFGDLRSKMDDARNKGLGTATDSWLTDLNAAKETKKEYEKKASAYISARSKCQSLKTSTKQNAAAKLPDAEREEALAEDSWKQSAENSIESYESMMREHELDVLVSVCSNYVAELQKHLVSSLRRVQELHSRMNEIRNINDTASSSSSPVEKKKKKDKEEKKEENGGNKKKGGSKRWAVGTSPAATLSPSAKKQQRSSFRLGERSNDKEEEKAEDTERNDSTKKEKEKEKEKEAGASSSSPTKGQENTKWEAYVWENGDKYEGEWLNNVFHGTGTFTFASGNVYKGQYANGKREGKGCYLYKNGDKYEGEYHADKKHGHGRFTFANGDCYDGEWVADKQHGTGTYTHSSGNKFVGQWKDDEKHGAGAFYWVDGDRFEGHWQHNQKHGKGLMIYSDGEEVEQWFHHGKEVSAGSSSS
ncbi:Phosphatidylinositol 4-phosphate 5-kinase [Balamuthia mandrillaris]